jgi:hypothetical protein
MNVLLGRLEIEPSVVVFRKAEAGSPRDRLVRFVEQSKHKWNAFNNSVGTFLRSNIAVTAYTSLVAAVAAIVFGAAVLLYHETQKPLLETQTETHQQLVREPSFEDMWAGEQPARIENEKKFREQLKAATKPNTSQNSLAFKKGPPGYYYAPVIEQGDGEGSVRYEWRSCALEKRPPYICYLNR